MPWRREDLATLAEVTCLIWKVPISSPYLSVITHRWVGIVFGYGYEYYQDKLDALAENSLRIELDKKRKSKANLDNYTEI